MTALIVSDDLPGRRRLKDGLHNQPCRADAESDRFVRIGDCEIDLRSRRVTRAGRVVDFTAKEFDLLAYLAVRPGHVFSRGQLLNAVWHSTPEWQASTTVTEHVRRIRTKIEVDPGHPTLVVTVRGAGYRFDPPAPPCAVAPSDLPPAESGVIVHVAGHIVFADAPACHLLAVADGPGLMGRHILDVVAATSRAAATDRMAAADAGHPRRSEIMRFQRSDGEEVTVGVQTTSTDWHGTNARRVEFTLISDGPPPLGQLVVGILADVTDAVIITDLDFHIQSWNSAAERVYGWPEHAVVGRHIHDVFQMDDSGQLAEASGQLRRMGRWSGRAKQGTRDGSTVTVLVSASMLRDEGGEPVGVVCVSRLAEVAGAAPVLEPDAALAARISQGIVDDEFVVHYEPIVSLADGAIVTLEALVRWEHPNRGTLHPAEFLDAAERSGSIVELGELVLEKACRQAAAWRHSGADIRLSVNVSTRQLASPGLTDRFLDILDRTGFSPTHLWLEVTETAVVEELENASDVLRALAALGVGVSIDDFGTGWASLTYLQSFPVHALKVDRSFVAGMGRNQRSTAIVRSILLLAAELELFVVAEGIETPEQHDLVKSMGCALGQGYLCGHAAPAGEVPIERARRIPDEVPQLVPVYAGGGQPVVAMGDGMAHANVPLVRRRVTSMPGPLQSEPSIVVAAMNRPGRDEHNRIEPDAVATLLRGLLRVSSTRGAVALLETTIRKMGGEIVPVPQAGEHALPIDVSLGEGPPMVVEVEPFTIARMQLERLLPRMVEDARQAVDLLRRTERLQDERMRDGLTGLGNRRVLDRALPRASSGSIVVIDLDDFKQVNDEHGHPAGDEVLSSFGRVIEAQVRAQDTSCRIGGDEFVLLLADVDVATAVALVERIRTSWSSASPRRVTFSAGVAAVTDDGGTAGLLAADRALYRAKDMGRDRTATANPASHPDARG